MNVERKALAKLKEKTLWELQAEARGPGITRGLAKHRRRVLMVMTRKEKEMSVQEQRRTDQILHPPSPKKVRYDRGYDQGVDDKARHRSHYYTLLDDWEKRGYNDGFNGFERRTKF